MKTALKISVALSLISNRTARSVYRGLLWRKHTKIQRQAYDRFAIFMAKEIASQK